MSNKRNAIILKLEELYRHFENFILSNIRLANIETQISMLYNIGTIFKVSVGITDSIMFFNKIDKFLGLIQLIIKLFREQKISNIQLSKYNTHLNWFRHKLRHPQKLNNKLLNIYNFIKNMPFFNKSLQFIPILTISNLEQQIDIEPYILYQCRYSLNYDNMPFDMNNTPITLSVPNTRRINQELENQLSNGVCFGFYDNNELNEILINTIHTKSTIDIKVVAKPNLTGYPGGKYYSFIKDGYAIWYLAILKIYLRHGETTESIINSDDSKIIKNLSIHSIPKNDMSNIITSLTVDPIDIGGIYAIHIYKDYHNAILHRIEHLLYDYGKTETSLFQVLICRTSTCPKILKIKNTNQVKSNIQCTICRIQYCSLCENLAHYGECGEIDNLLNVYINTNTKKCPNIECNISYEKNEGCNHMRCLSCGTHFCWLCGLSYNIDDIIDHYDTGNISDNELGPYSPKCIGLL